MSGSACNKTLGQRGRSRDPLCGIRRLLRRRHDRLPVKAHARLQAGLIAGDPDGEVTLAWTSAQDPMNLYQLDDPDQPARAEQLIDDLRRCPIPELSSRVPRAQAAPSVTRPMAARYCNAAEYIQNTASRERTSSPRTLAVGWHATCSRSP
jgi:hypothetical protein